MTRGEIWWVDFGVPFGSEVGFRRPVIVLQNNILKNLSEILFCFFVFEKMDVQGN